MSVYDLASPPDQFGCRHWQGRCDRDGYGVHGRTKAHIAVWTEVNGPVPDGKVLEHRCRVRDCVRLVHLEPVTQRENQFRKRWSYQVREERCPYGHDMRLYSVVLSNHGRVCRRCNQEGP